MASALARSALSNVKAGSFLGLEGGARQAAGGVLRVVPTMQRAPARVASLPQTRGLSKASRIPLKAAVVR